jgi:hypothetical protein
VAMLMMATRLSAGEQVETGSVLGTQEVAVVVVAVEWGQMEVPWSGQPRKEGDPDKVPAGSSVLYSPSKSK